MEYEVANGDARERAHRGFGALGEHFSGVDRRQRRDHLPLFDVCRVEAGSSAPRVDQPPKRHGHGRSDDLLVVAWLVGECLQVEDENGLVLRLVDPRVTAHRAFGAAIGPGGRPAMRSSHIGAAGPRGEERVRDGLSLGGSVRTAPAERFEGHVQGVGEAAKCVAGFLKARWVDEGEVAGRAANNAVEGGRVAAAFRERCIRVVGYAAQEGARRRKCSHQGQHERECVARFGLYQQAAELCWQREAEQTLSARGECAVGFGDCAEVDQALPCFCESMGAGGVEKRELFRACNTAGCRGEHQLVQLFAVDFWRSARCKTCICTPQSNRYAWPEASGASGALVRAVRSNGQERQVGATVSVLGAPHEAAVDDHADAWQGERRFRDVGCEHNAASGWRTESGLLGFEGQAPVERENIVGEIGEGAVYTGDFGLSGQKDQDVAVEVGRCVDGAADPLLYAADVGKNRVAALVPNLDRIHPAFADNRRPIEVCGDALHVHRGARDHQSGYGAPFCLVMRPDGEQEVDVEGTLVKLVEHERRELRELGACHALKGHTGRDKHDLGVWCAAVFVPHLPADDGAGLDAL